MVVVNRCWLCELDGESVDHLLLHCGAARDLWNAFFFRFGLCWIMPSIVKDLYASWWTGGRARSAVVWKMVPLCIMWCIWRERNNRCFDGKSRSHEELLHLFFFTLFTWTAGWLAPQVISFSDFLSFFSLSPNPHCVLPVHQGLRPYALLLYSIDFSKKKKKYLPFIHQI
jgi:hypothetical protein